MPELNVAEEKLSENQQLEWTRVVTQDVAVYLPYRGNYAIGVNLNFELEY